MRPEPEFFKEFAEKSRFKITRDECDDPVIEGKFGHFYVQSETKELIGICLTDQRWPITTAHKKNKLLRMRPDRCHLEGDVEGIWVSDVHDREFIAEAAKVIGVKRKRQYSEQYLQVLRERAQKMNEGRAQQSEDPDPSAGENVPTQDHFPVMPIVDPQMAVNSGIGQ